MEGHLPRIAQLGPQGARTLRQCLLECRLEGTEVHDPPGQGQIASMQGRSKDVSQGFKGDRTHGGVSSLSSLNVSISSPGRGSLSCPGPSCSALELVHRWPTAEWEGRRACSPESGHTAGTPNTPQEGQAGEWNQEGGSRGGTRVSSSLPLCCPLTRGSGHLGPGSQEDEAPPQDGPRAGPFSFSAPGLSMCSP